MKKIIEFIKSVFWIFRRKKIVDFVEYETPLMLNKKYLRKFSGKKRYVKTGRNEKA